MVAAIACPLRFDLPIGPFATVSAIDAALLVSAGYFALRFAGMRPIEIGPRSVALFVLLPAVIAMLSLVWAVDDRLTWAGSLRYAYTALIFLVGLQFGAHLTSDGLKRVALVLLTGWLAGSVLMYLGMPGFDYFLPEGASAAEAELAPLLASLYTRLGHPYVGQSNDYAPLLALVGFILLGLARVHKDRLAAASSAVAFAASVLTFSRGLWIGLVLSLALYCIVTRVAVVRVALVIATATVLGGLFALFAQDSAVTAAGREIEFSEIVEERLSAANVEARLQGYAETLAQVAERPWLGYGAGYYDATRPDGLVAAHSAVVEQWKFFGLVLGTVTAGCYVGILLWLMRLGRRAGRWEPYTHALACAWACLVATSLMETFFEAAVPRATIYFLLGLCVAHATRLRPTGQIT
jgi:O-antigen ligase